MGMLIFWTILAIPTGIAVYFTERVDRPRRRAMRLESLVQPAE
ncbi:hypothetical protein [uncultured Sphingomonas sp.]